MYSLSVNYDEKLDAIHERDYLVSFVIFVYFEPWFIGITFRVKFDYGTFLDFVDARPRINLDKHRFIARVGELKTYQISASILMDLFVLATPLCLQIRFGSCPGLDLCQGDTQHEPC